MGALRAAGALSGAHDKNAVSKKLIVATDFFFTGEKNRANRGRSSR